CIAVAYRRCMGWHRCVLPANLLRLRGLFGHGHRAWPDVRVRIPGKLQLSLCCYHRSGVLEALAFVAVGVVSRLPVHTAGWQPQGRRTHCLQPVHGVHPVWLLAWRRLDVHFLGILARAFPGARTRTLGTDAADLADGSALALRDGRGVDRLDLLPRRILHPCVAIPCLDDGPHGSAVDGYRARDQVRVNRPLDDAGGIGVEY